MLLAFFKLTLTRASLGSNVLETGQKHFTTANTISIAMFDLKMLNLFVLCHLIVLYHCFSKYDDKTSNREKRFLEWKTA